LFYKKHTAIVEVWRLVEILVKEMIKLNAENSVAIISAAQEIMDNGQLWVAVDGEEVYIPELIEQLQSILDLDAEKTNLERN